MGMVYLGCLTGWNALGVSRVNDMVVYRDTKGKGRVVMMLLGHNCISGIYVNHAVYTA